AHPHGVTFGQTVGESRSPSCRAPGPPDVAVQNGSVVAHPHGVTFGQTVGESRSPSCRAPGPPDVAVQNG
ncbi:hypothetical protein CKQ79_30005, partial [Klebsiella pneumoniae]